MSQPLPSQTASREEDEVPIPERPPSPPLHTTFSVRGVHPPTFSAFKPRDFRIPSSQAMSHVAWSCDGKKLAAVGIDKMTRVWNPEKSMEVRSATTYSGGHSEDIDYVSWNPSHPELFCTTSQRERRMVFWDARQSRHIQQVSLKLPPIQTAYAPDGRSMLYVTSTHYLYFLDFGKATQEATKPEWHPRDMTSTLTGTACIYTNSGDCVVVAHNTEHSFRIYDLSTGLALETPAAHVGGCLALAADPRGRYFATGGLDSIVNIFDSKYWICARTITACEYGINALSYSYDGEYLAIANGGNYIDICATETSAPLHRVPSLGPASTVAWHPSKYVMAYCGQTKSRADGPQAAPMAFVSMFGLLE